MSLIQSKNNIVDISIVVFSCDAYQDLWEGFFDSFELNWPECKFDIYLVNNNLNYSRKGVNVINGGDSDWSTRARIAMNSINSKYFILFLEDFYLPKKIDDKKINQVAEYVFIKEINYYQLNITDKEDYYKWRLFDYDFVWDIPKNRDYWVDISIAIWQKTFFLELLGEGNYSAWEFEFNRNIDAKNPDKYLNKLCLLDSRNLIPMCPMVVQGKYYPKSIKVMKNLGFEFNSYNRPIMTHLEVFKQDLKGFVYKLRFGKKFFKSVGRLLGFKFVSDNYPNCTN